MTVITYGEAISQGIPRSQLPGPKYKRLFQGIYTTMASPDLKEWVKGARRFLPEDAVLSGLTALRARGLKLGEDLPLTFVTKQRAPTERRGVDVRHRRELPPGPIAPVMDAYIEFVREATFADAVAVGDALLRRGMLTAKQVEGLLAIEHPAVRSAAKAVRVGAHSVRETLLRLAITTAGLPEPHLQETLGDGAGIIGDVDLYFKKFGIVVEYEGNHHRISKAQWNADLAKYERPSKAKFHLIRVTAEDMHDPIALINRIHEGLRSRGYRGRRPRFTARFLDLFEHSVL